MIFLHLKSDGSIIQSLESDFETAKLYLQPGDSLATGCRFLHVDNERLWVSEGVLTRKPANDDLFDWGAPTDELVGEGEAVEIVWTAPAAN